MASTETVQLMFALLDSLGFKPPRSFDTDAGTASGVRAWQIVLGDVADEELIAAATAWASAATDSWWPVPGAILEHVPGRNTDDDADIAWGELLRLLRRHGSYNVPLPPDAQDVPPMRWAMQSELMWVGLQALGGWSTLCAATYDSMVANRAAFRNAYRATQDREKRELGLQRARKLLGDKPVRLLEGG